MKKQILIALFLLSIKCSAQDLIYLTDGTTISGKISEITSDKVKFKNLANPTGPLYSKNISNVEVAFNAVGDYLVFAQPKPLTEKQKQDFISSNPIIRPFDIIIDSDGKVLPVNVGSETENDITVSYNSREQKFLKSTLVFIIRRNGNHKLFSSVELALPYLALDKAKIDNLLSTQNQLQQPVVATKPITTSVEPNQNLSNTQTNEQLEVPDITLFGTKAKQKVEEFTNYLIAITDVNSNHNKAVKSIDQACALFLNEQVRVEVSNVNTQKSNKYKIRDYLNRLLISSGHYDRVQVEYANVNYASKFTKGIDGNYYGTVTFVQKFQGFIDGNLAYSDITKRNVEIVLKHYEKAVNGTMVGEWDLYLDDVGVVETRRL